MGACHGALPPTGDRAGSWIAVAVALPSFCTIWADTWSPTLTAPMLETLPVTLMEPVTAAVTACAAPPIVMDPLLTAVTLPITKSVPPAPPGPVPGSAPPPGWMVGWLAGPGVAEEPERPSTASTIPAPAAAARSAITSRRAGRNRRIDGRSPGQPSGVGGAAGRPPAVAPSAWPPCPPGGPSSGHRSSGQPPLPGPAGPEGRCDIGCSLLRRVTSLDWAPAPRCPVSPRLPGPRLHGGYTAGATARARV